ETGPKKRLLAPCVIIDSRLRNPQSPGDVINGRRRITILRKCFCGCLKDSVPLCVRGARAATTPDRPAVDDLPTHRSDITQKRLQVSNRFSLTLAPLNGASFALASPFVAGINA